MTANDTDDRSEIRRSRPERNRSDGVLVGFRDRDESDVDSGTVTARSNDGDRADDQPPVRLAVLLAPLALATAYAIVAAVIGFETFDTGSGGVTGALAFGLLGALLLVSGWTTARLYDDARWIAARSLDWTPNPWSYVLGGAATLVLLRVLELVVLESTVQRPALYLAGNALVALALASVVAGPAYALRRERHFRSG